MNHFRNQNAFTNDITISRLNPTKIAATFMNMFTNA